MTDFISRRCLICANINPCRSHSAADQQVELSRNDAEIAEIRARQAMTDSDNQSPSKRAREAAADLMHLDEEWSVAFEQAVRAGSEDDCEFVEAFAKFERTLLDEIKARVRGLLTPEARLPSDRNGRLYRNQVINEALAAIDTMGRE